MTDRVYDTDRPPFGGMNGWLDALVAVSVIGTAVAGLLGYVQAALDVHEWSLRALESSSVPRWRDSLCW
jgi:hypothetical protein